MLPEAVLNYETYAFFIMVSIIALKKGQPPDCPLSFYIFIVKT